MRASSVDLQDLLLLYQINQSGKPCSQSDNQCCCLNPSSRVLDWFHGSRMDGFLATVPPYHVPGPALDWTKRESRFLTPHGLSYLELCRALLSQVNTGLLTQVNLGLPAPAVKRADTRECGVQVNAKVDKVVQCSLGPKTLLCLDGDQIIASKSTRSPDVFKPDLKALCMTPPVSSLRFLRPVSIYSPVFDRRIQKKLCDEDGSEGEAESVELESEKDPETDQSCEDLNTTINQSSKGSNFQFLEQRYGFFHCKKCNIRWESAYVWCISGTSKVYYKQLCRKCQVGFNPYRVESILCQGCSQTCCSCEKRQRHINMKRPHRQDLCCRCKGMRLSCDATYSFKYIV